MRAMWERIREIVRKEFNQTLRDPRLRALLIGPPLLQLVLFGYAVNLDVQSTRAAWMDLDRSAESRALLAAFEGSQYFVVVAAPEREESVAPLVDRGEVQTVIRVLPGFSRDVHRGNTAAVQVLVDGTNSNTAAILSAYAAEIVARHAAEVARGRENALRVRPTAESGAPVAADAPAPVALPRVWFNPDLASRVYFVPGVIVNIIALITVMLTAMSIVREKEIGTMEQLMVTPLRPVELILGKLLPFAIIGIFQTVFIVAAALLVFGTPLRGSVGLLLVSALLFLLSTLGIGLFISTISRTQQQAMMSTFFFFLPAMLLSGFAFPIRNMPGAVQVITYLNPLRYFMQIVRGLFLKGTGLDALWQEMAALAVFGVVILGLAALRFHRRPD